MWRRLRRRHRATLLRGWSRLWTAAGCAQNVSTSNGTFNQFEGLGGDDLITGNGSIQVPYGNATSGVTITIGANGADSATGDASTGHDTISGDDGNDTLIGGGGNDNFACVSGATNGATVADFTGNGASPGGTLEFHGFELAADGATFTQIGSSNQRIVYSGLDAHSETITINGGVHATDFHFLT